jgi:hypothetical protein
MKEWLEYMREIISEVRPLGATRYLIVVMASLTWADARRRMGMTVKFSREAVQAADQLGDGTEGVARYNACRKGGDRAGMRLWREAAVYDIFTEIHGKDCIRVVG